MITAVAVLFGFGVGGTAAIVLLNGIASNHTTVTVPVGATSSPAAGHTVRFEITASAGTTRIRWLADDDQGELVDERSPWIYDYPSTRRHPYASVTATVRSGTVTCRLLIDGRLIDDGVSQRQVTCSGAFVG